MKINELRPAKGAFHPRKRVGRGIGSGHGKTSGRGMKGQKARSGGQIHPRFEGGQMPLVRRVPKRGFHNPCAEEWEIVNVSALNRFPDGTEVTPELLQECGLVEDRRSRVKILAKGELKRRLVVKAHAFSARAKALIEERGGKAEVL
ncbi:50S ribosomal protein L15 [Candidatus Caldatribacterium sp. SIUC1]|uniref:50S ribosomal protein L15 n=1 Tax=Candidatus Caldatribacterium sp. SIUC1 TaxID=3418365 RepID=UPI003F68FDCB